MIATSKFVYFSKDLQKTGVRRNVAIYLGVSKNRGTPKSSILIGFSKK